MTESTNLQKKYIIEKYIVLANNNQNLRTRLFDSYISVYDDDAISNELAEVFKLLNIHTHYKSESKICLKLCSALHP